MAKGAMLREELLKNRRLPSLEKGGLGETRWQVPVIQRCGMQKGVAKRENYSQWVVFKVAGFGIPPGRSFC